MAQNSELTIDAQSGTVVIRTDRVHQSCAWIDVRELIGRLISAPCVESLLIDRQRATVILRLRPSMDAAANGFPMASSPLRVIAQALRQPSPKRNLPGPAYSDCSELDLRCHPAEGVTAGHVVCESPCRVRLRHPLIRCNPGLAQRIEAEFAALPGIESVSASPLTGSVLVLFQHCSVTSGFLLAAVERIACGEDLLHGGYLAGPPISHWVGAAGCLGLAVTSEFFVPGISAITAMALVANNLPTLGRGLVELVTFRWKIASLYTVIMGTTLASGQFLAAALMQASITAWHAWTTNRLRKVVRNLESDPTWTSRLLNDSTDDATGIESCQRIAVGSVVRVPVGAILPFDGIVVSGTGRVDEHGMHGDRTPTHCQTGERVFAGSVLLDGGLEVRVTAVNSRTRLSTVRRAVRSLICEAVGEGGATPQAKIVASRFVPFTFATGSAALLAGDITTLAAVLRPDFCTGPSLNERMGALTGVSHLLHDGWLVKNCAALHALAHARTVVIARMPEEANGEEAKPTVCYRELSGLTPAVQLHEVRGTTSDCVGYIRNLRVVHGGVAVVAGQTILKQLASEDLVRISITPDLCLDQPYADVVALHSSPQRLEDLLRVLHESIQPGKSAWTVVLTCNALAIGGAFLVGLTSLHVVLLTNIGALATGVLYNRHVKRSKALLDSHCVRKVPSAYESFPLAVESPYGPVEMPDHSSANSNGVRRRIRSGTNGRRAARINRPGNDPALTRRESSKIEVAAISEVQATQPTPV